MSLKECNEQFANKIGSLPVDLSAIQLELNAADKQLPKWNQFGGSQNIPVIAKAAASDFQWIARMCDIWKREGLFGTELGSPGFYYSSVCDCLISGLKDARNARDRAAISSISQALRAIWAFDSLTALPTPKISTSVTFADQTFMGGGNSKKYSGLTCAVAGNRWNPEDYDRWIDSDIHGYYLSIALDYFPRSGPFNRNGALASLLGIRRFTDHATPALVGLTEGERSVLLATVNGDPKAAAQAAAWFAEFGPLHTHVFWSFRAVRSASATQQVFYGPYPNPNKPCMAITTLQADGTWTAMTPCANRKKGIVSGYQVVENEETGTYVASVNEGCGKTVEADSLKETIYDFTFIGNSISSI